jgi:hypothetical protein
LPRFFLVDFLLRAFLRRLCGGGFLLGEYMVPRQVFAPQLQMASSSPPS